MSVRAKVEPDFDPADFDQDDFDEEQKRRRHYQRRDQEDDEDEDEDEKKRRREKENEKRKAIRRRAEYMAQTKGGYVDDWILLLTPRGRPFSDHLIGQGYRSPPHSTTLPRTAACSISRCNSSTRTTGEDVPAPAAGMPA